MAKKKERPPEEGSPAWMATFSDLMNLLLCFFVLLFASSTMDEGKIQKIAASFDNMSFSIISEGSISLLEGNMMSGGVVQAPDIEQILSDNYSIGFILLVYQSGIIKCVDSVTKNYFDIHVSLDFEE